MNDLTTIRSVRWDYARENKLIEWKWNRIIVECALGIEEARNLFLPWTIRINHIYTNTHILNSFALCRSATVFLEHTLNISFLSSFSHIYNSCLFKLLIFTFSNLIVQRSSSFRFYLPFLCFTVFLINFQFINTACNILHVPFVIQHEICVPFYFTILLNLYHRHCTINSRIN